MKKWLFIFLILTSNLYAQHKEFDCLVLGSGLVQHYKNPTRDDLILHQWTGYFGTSVLYYYVDKTKLPKWSKQIIPPLSILLVSISKELLDSKFDKLDIYNTMGGCSVSIINYNINLEKVYGK